MKVLSSICLLTLLLCSFTPRSTKPDGGSWIRINQLGYLPQSTKTAVWASKSSATPSFFELYEKTSHKMVFRSTNVKVFGAYGPFKTTARLQFSEFRTPGTYYIKAMGVQSPDIIIGKEVYKGSADFALRYLRQQRCGFNPSTMDSCHTHDGFVVYGKNIGLKDSTHFDAVGGWHDASDYLQYGTTTANATFHLLMAYRDFPNVFTDEMQRNGTKGKNGMADVLDEAKWGLDWLLKMHPKPGIMFNQLADDRDHISMRMPGQDHQYGKGFERPLYAIDGLPQQRGKFMNDTKGTSSTAAKYASAFSLGSSIFKQHSAYSRLLEEKAQSAYRYATRKKGVTQTASVKSPYIYAEDNWVDDMELALAVLKPNSKALDSAMWYAQQEPISPWMLTDTAKHYQWYPFINLGHYELAKQSSFSNKKQLIDYYKKGIEAVWERAKQNAFYRGVPYIWCSNNLTVAFAIQCMWYQSLSNDTNFNELEQANFDWLFGCNPWGTSMVYGLPSWGDTPTDPHSAFTHLGKLPIDGGLVDGPVYTSIYKNLIGIKLTKADDYSDFQSDLAVYHDDYGDYSTNEPTMDGTASLVYLLAAFENKSKNNVEQYEGAIIRGDSNNKEMALMFSADEFGEGGDTILTQLRKAGVKASFFLTGNFYSDKKNRHFIQQAIQDGHYLGAHSDRHLLYADWTKRDSTLISQTQFRKDINTNYKKMRRFGIDQKTAHYFLPPYEWYNQEIANWTKAEGLQLINFTPGTGSNADYTYPEMGPKKYKDSETIYKNIIKLAAEEKLNGHLLLLHLGTDPRRKDKFYYKLGNLLEELKAQGYRLSRVDELLNKKTNR